MDNDTKISDLTVGEFRLLMREILVDHEAHMIYRKYNGSGVIGTPAHPFWPRDQRGAGSQDYGQQDGCINRMQALHQVNQTD